ncbi:MAG: hypothetical protein JO111_19295 [Caulobacteraceae bacterium]|nr:hypothetical protein [Caulobacteraceae bacterium]
MMMFQTLARVMTSTADTLKIECAACQRRAEWPRTQAFEQLGSDACPPEARHRLRCAACGARRPRIWI